MLGISERDIKVFPYRNLNYSFDFPAEFSFFEIIIIWDLVKEPKHIYKHVDNFSVLTFYVINKCHLHKRLMLTF